MSTTLLERARSSHEDIELFERAIVQAIVDDAKNHRENINHSHWVNIFAEKILDRTKQLATIYQDNDGARKEEIAAIGGKGQEPFDHFYAQLNDLKEYHKRFPTLSLGRPEAEQMLNTLDIEKLVEFSGEESYGRYLDLHHFYERYINLKGVDGTEKSYLGFLRTFHRFVDRDIVKDSTYRQYLVDLIDYLIGFFRRTQPLYELDPIIKKCEEDFEKEWSEGTFIPVGYNEVDEARESNPLWDKYSRKLFTNENAFKNYLKGKNFKRNVIRYNTVYKEICLLEVKVSRLASLLTERIEASLINVERKLAKAGIELGKEEDEDSIAEEEEEEESADEEIRLTKQNYPMDYAGNPIPYWLYKLHGLGIEYKCEICGNESYWGRRAFEMHFNEWRHTHGLQMLNIEPVKEFNEITSIADALALDKKLKERRVKERWNPETMEECEDTDGNVMNLKTYRDLAAQGLL